MQRELGIQLRSIVSGAVIFARDDGYGQNNPKQANGRRQALDRYMEKRTMFDGDAVPVWYPLEKPARWKNHDGAQFEPLRSLVDRGIWSEAQDKVLSVMLPKTQKKLTNAKRAGDARSQKLAKDNAALVSENADLKSQMEQLSKKLDAFIAAATAPKGSDDKAPKGKGRNAAHAATAGG